MASSSLPAILSTKPTLSPESMSISTQTIDPTICTNNHVQFRLPKVGVLDAGSTITLAVTRSGAADHLFFPIATGIHSMIEKATLSIGGNEIASSPDHGHDTQPSPSIYEPIKELEGITLLFLCFYRFQFARRTLVWGSS